jgi:hypothetical protein
VTDGSPGRDSKVAALIDRYGLEGIGAELERRWTAPEERRDGLRALAEEFNRRLLREAMVEAGMDPLKGEAANAYRLLTDDAVTSGTRTETEQRLRREGVDVDRLRGEFVSYQAIRTYLTEVRGASYDRPEGDPGEARGSLERLIGRTAAVVERRLDRFRAAGDIALGSFRVRTTVTVYCEDCDSQYRATELLGRGGCDCERETGS